MSEATQDDFRTFPTPPVPITPVTQPIPPAPRPHLPGPHAPNHRVLAATALRRYPRNGPSPSPSVTVTHGHTTGPEVTPHDPLRGAQVPMPPLTGTPHLLGSSSGRRVTISARSLWFGSITAAGIRRCPALARHFTSPFHYDLRTARSSLPSRQPQATGIHPSNRRRTMKVGSAIDIGREYEVFLYELSFPYSCAAPVRRSR